jgi:hypothetical protein
MESGGGAHYWANEVGRLRHTLNISNLSGADRQDKFWLTGLPFAANTTQNLVNDGSELRMISELG